MDLDLRPAKERRQRRQEKDRPRTKRDQEKNFDLRQAKEKLEREHGEEKERASRKREIQKIAEDDNCKWMEEHRKKAKAAIERKEKWVTERAGLEDVKRSQSKEKCEREAGIGLAKQNSTVPEAIDRGRFLKEVQNFVNSPTAWKRSLDILSSAELMIDDFSSPKKKKYFDIDPVPDTNLKRQKEELEHMPVRNLKAMGEVKREILEFTLDGLASSAKKSRSVDPIDYLANLASAKSAGVSLRPTSIIDLTAKGEVWRIVLEFSADRLANFLTRFRAVDVKGFLDELGGARVPAATVQEIVEKIRRAKNLVRFPNSLRPDISKHPSSERIPENVVHQPEDEKTSSPEEPQSHLGSANQKLSETVEWFISSVNDNESLPESLGELAGLEKLYLVAGQPESLGRLSFLKDSSITGPKLESLPKRLGEIAGLFIRSISLFLKHHQGNMEATSRHLNDWFSIVFLFAERSLAQR